MKDTIGKSIIVAVMALLFCGSANAFDTTMMLTTFWGRTGPKMVMGDVAAARINAAGWYAEIDLTGYSTGGTYTLGGSTIPDNAVMVFTVQTPGFNSIGAAVTNTKTIYGTKFKRKIYPNNAVADEIAGSGITTIRVALSDWIYSGDVVTLATLAPGAYNDGDATVASSLVPVTNNSAESHQKVIANWSVPGHSIVGSSFDLRCVAFHRSARERKPVAAVKFTVTDQHSHTVTTTVSSPSISNYNNSDAQKITEYIGTIDTTTLTDGDTLTANFTAYPIDGDSGAVLNTADGVNTMPTPLYSSQTYVLDKSGSAYGRTVAVVSTTGNDGTGAVVDYTSFNPGSPPSAYASIGAASNAIAAYNNTNRSRNNNGGGIIYLRAGNYSFAGTGTTYSPTAWLTIATFPGDAQAAINNKSGSNNISNKTKFENIAVTVSTNLVFQNSTYLWFDRCTWHPVVLSGGIIYGNGMVVYFTGCDLYDASDYYPYSTTNAPRAIVRGCYTRESATNGYATVYTFIGNNWRNAITQVGNTSNSPADDGFIVAYNYVDSAFNNYILWGLGGTTIKGTISHGAAIVQNIFERRVYGSPPNIQISGDGVDKDSSNVLLWHNTVVGARANLAYNDYNLNDVGPKYHKHWSIKHNIFYRANSVTDKDAHGGTPDNDRYGNHSIIHGVGVSGNILRGNAIGGTDDSGDYLLEYAGIYGLSNSINAADLYVDDNSSSGDGTGNGDYRLSANSPARGIIPAGYAILPYSLNGYARGNSGGGDIGAMLDANE